MIPHNLVLGLVLPPLGLALLAAVLGLLAWRGRRWAGLVAALLLLVQVALATPLANAALEASLQRVLLQLAPIRPGEPRAIIVLGAEVAHAVDGWKAGPLTLERMAAAASLARQSGLPLLVTGGPVAPGPSPPVAEVMAGQFRSDFGLEVRWIEPEAGNTLENARLSAALLRREGITGAYLVSHEWHLPRAMLSFRGTGLVPLPTPVRRALPLELRASSFVPRADRWGTSWYLLREWAGLGVYALQLRLRRG